MLQQQTTLGSQWLHNEFTFCTVKGGLLLYFYTVEGVCSMVTEAYGSCTT